MPHTYFDSLFHVVFSTKGRLPFELEPMHAYLGGIARKHEMRALAVGGTKDHVHILLQLPPTIALSKAVQLLKGGSSKWFNEHGPEMRFEWQEGFSAFSVSRSNAEAVISYIQSQEEHHRKRDFVQEYKKLLEKHGIKYDSEHFLG